MYSRLAVLCELLKWRLVSQVFPLQKQATYLVFFHNKTFAFLTLLAIFGKSPISNFPAA